MKKNGIIIGIILGVIVLLVGAFFLIKNANENKTSSKGQIKVTVEYGSSRISGANDESNLTKNVKTFDISLGKKMKVKGIEDNEIEFKITEINKDNVKIKSSKELFISGNLSSSGNTEFTINKGNALVLYSDMADVIENFTFEINL